MSDPTQEQSVRAYFDGIAAKDMSRVPWAKDATLRTPLNPAGGENALIRGRKSILEFFDGILPAVSSLRFIRYYGGDRSWSAGQAEISCERQDALCPRRISHRERRDYRAAKPL